MIWTVKTNFETLLNKFAFSELACLMFQWIQTKHMVWPKHCLGIELHTNILFHLFVLRDSFVIKLCCPKTKVIADKQLLLYQATAKYWSLSAYSLGRLPSESTLQRNTVIFSTYYYVVWTNASINEQSKYGQRRTRRNCKWTDFFTIVLLNAFPESTKNRSNTVNLSNSPTLSTFMTRILCYTWPASVVQCSTLISSHFLLRFQFRALQCHSHPKSFCPWALLHRLAAHLSFAVTYFLATTFICIFFYMFSQYLGRSLKPNDSYVSHTWAQ